MLFLSISSFNNAGFEILPDSKIGGSSLIGFADDKIILATVSVMILMGALSYATLSNIITKKKWSLFNLDTKLVIKIEQIEIIRIEFGFNSVGILLKK